jgi:hypothetical protein
MAASMKITAFCDTVLCVSLKQTDVSELHYIPGGYNLHVMKRLIVLLLFSGQQNENKTILQTTSVTLVRAFSYILVTSYHSNNLLNNMQSSKQSIQSFAVVSIWNVVFWVMTL